MGKLFKIEMMKLRKSTAMLVLLIVAIALSLLNVGVYGLVNLVSDSLLSVFGKVDGYNMAVTMTSDTSDIMMMVVILMAVLIGGDFSARTLQTQVAAGYSRFKIIISRFITVAISYVILYTLYFSITVIGMTIIFGFGDGITSDMVSELVLKLFLSFIMAMTMLSMYMLFAFLLKSTGATIGVCLPVMLFGVSIIQMLSMVSEVVYDIISFTPFGQSMLLGDMFGLEEVEPIKFICVCIVWFSGFMSLSFLSFRKAELK